MVTGKVYYLKGFEYNKVRYYTLTEDLYDEVGSGIQAKDYKEVRKEEVVFRVNRILPGRNAVTVDALVPSEAASISVTATNSIAVASAITENGYKKYSINASKAVKNYVVTVKYTLNGTSKTVKYTVSNVDVAAPAVSVSLVKYSGYTVINFEPNNPNEVAKIKCDKGNLTVAYFEKYGKVVEDNQYICYTAGTYTVYYEDLLGNSSVSTLNITIN